MENPEPIQIGMQYEKSFQVEERHTAAHVGSGDLSVLATPSMIAFMEDVARDLLAQHLPPGDSSVGVLVDVRHLAATPMGQPVRVACQVTEIDGRRVTFNVEAWDALERVGEGRHQRVIIDAARFLARLDAKRQNMPS
jgi:fluoroacetyl-CoA thioesterase